MCDVMDFACTLISGTGLVVQLLTAVIEFQFETLTLKVMLLGAGDQVIKGVPTWTARISVL